MIKFSVCPYYISKLNGNPMGRPQLLNVGETNVKRKRPPRSEKSKSDRVKKNLQCQRNLNNDLVKEANKNVPPSPQSQTNYLENTGGYKNVDDKFSPASKENLYAVVKAQYQSHKSKGKYDKTFQDTIYYPLIQVF